MTFDFPIQSRTAIMASAREAFLSGKTADECPENFRHYAHVWRFEFEQCVFEAASTGDHVKESV